MFCKKCGALISDDEIYCYNCQSLDFDNTGIEYTQSKKNNAKNTIEYTDKLKYTNGQINKNKHDVGKWIVLSVVLMYVSFIFGMIALIVCLKVYSPAVSSNNFEKANSTKRILKWLLIVGLGSVILEVIASLALTFVKLY